MGAGDFGASSASAGTVPCAPDGSTHVVRVVFGWPTNFPEPKGRLPEIRQQIEAAVSMADSYLDQSGGKQHIRWKCDGLSRLEIAVESVPNAEDDPLTFEAIVGSLSQRGYRDARTLYVVFLEPFLGYPGVGEATMPEAPPEGPQYALIVHWTGLWALHEVGHMLGAVPGSAPHQFQNGHCSEQWDVMCRHPLENTFLAQSGLYRLACPDNPAWYFDCNHDDYYLHDGDWWDVADSPFLHPSREKGSSD